MKKLLNAIETIISLILSLFAMLFVAWLNGKQKEFDQMK